MTGVSRSTRSNWLVFATFFAVTLAAAGLYFLAAGLSDITIRAVLRVSGRAALIVLLVILYLRPLQQLTSFDWIDRLRRKRRQVGITFAAIMAAHLLLIGLRVQHTPDISFGLTGLALGATTYAMTALMFITSFDGPTRWLGARNWKRLHRAGIAWFAFFFLLPRSAADLASPHYWVVAGPVTLALVLRAIAWAKNRRPA